MKKQIKKMPQCSVIGCGQRKRKRLSASNINLHRLPANEERKRKWLENLGEENLNLTTKCVYVCSLHFDVSAFTTTASNDNIVLNRGALPMKIMIVCRMCLVGTSNVKFYSMKTFKLKEAYELLTGILPLNEELPQVLCVECMQRLRNYEKLRIKALKAHSLLMGLIDASLKNIKSIDRDENKLMSTLTEKVYKPNYYDTYIEETVIDTSEIGTSNKIGFNFANSIHDLSTNDLRSDYDESFEDSFKETIENGYENDSIKLPIANPMLDLPTNDFNIESDGNTEEYIEETTDNDYENNNTDIEYIDTTYSTDESLPQQEMKKEKRKLKEIKDIKQKTKETKIDKRTSRKPVNASLKKLFKITDLTFEEQVADLQKRKESSNYKNAKFKCLECFKGFKDEKAYKSHMTRHTNRCGEFVCGICNLHFKLTYQVRKHVTAYHKRKFSCNQCSFVTPNRQAARAHEMWHTGKQFKCPHCPLIFYKFKSYMGHLRIKHPSDFVCELCGYSFVSANGLRLHKSLKHRFDDDVIPEDGPVCECCNLKFTSKEALCRHLQVSAKDEGLKVEEKRSRRRVLRDGNQPRSKVVGPIPCEQCGVQLEDVRAYYHHFRFKHPDKNRTKYPSMKTPCMCEVCGRMFASKTFLNYHRFVHTGKKLFPCELCGKSFSTKQSLIHHNQVHSSVTYGCKLCGKRFSLKRNRNRHMLIHSRLKPFKCEVCGKGYKSIHEKRSHFKYVHLKKPWPKRSRPQRRDTTGKPKKDKVPFETDELEVEYLTEETDIDSP